MLNGRRFFKILAHLEFSDDTFFLNHSLEALDSLLYRLCFITLDVCHLYSPPLPTGSRIAYTYYFFPVHIVNQERSLFLQVHALFRRNRNR